MLLVNQVMSAVMQLGLFTLIPFVWYLITHRTAKGFLGWIGLRRTTKCPFKATLITLIVFLAVMFAPYLYLYFSNSITYSGFVYDSFRQTGWSAQTMLCILFWATIQTSLSEEILMRGFIGKRCIAKFGFNIGNTIQAVLFGLVHVVSVWDKGLLPILLIVVLTGGMGYAMGWLAEKKANGSILFGWLVHAFANIISPILILLFLFGR